MKRKIDSARGLFSGDRVPDTVFGIRVAQDEGAWTEEDLAFFREHPEAAGYYDLDDGEAEGQADEKGGFFDSLRRRVGETGEVLDAGIAWMERQAKQTADMDVPVLSKVADAVVQPALVGARAAIANVTSGGGRYYQPEVRDERYFSQAALRELGESVEGMHGRTSGRADGADNAAQFNLTQTVGGFSVRDGAVTDKFDINRSYHGVPGWMTRTARAVLGAEEDPDAGKVQTRIPLSALGLQSDAKGGWEAVDVKGTGHVVYPAAYNSALSESQEAQYQAWRATLPKPLQYEGDYDLRGYWLDPDTVKEGVRDGTHFIDRYKKPNHPTFSVESRYATGRDARLAGTWRGEEYVPSPFVARMDPDAVAQRFNDAIDLAVPFVKEHEGFRAKAYRDVVGKWTVGYGQTEIRDAETGRMRPVREGDAIAEKDASEFVSARIRANAAAIYRSMPWTRRAGKGAVAQLIDIAYNSGLGTLTRNSPTLNREGAAAISEHDVNKVVFREAPTYRTAGGKTIPGLVNRRADGLKSFRDALLALPRTNVNRNAVPTTVERRAP